MNEIDRYLIKAIWTIVLLCVAGIIFLTSLGLWQDDSNVKLGDQVAGALSQIASAGVGALAGYFTSRVIQDRRHKENPDDPE